MRRTLVCLTVLLGAAVGGAQQASHAGFWKGKLQITQYNFSNATVHDYVRGRDYTRRGVDLWKEEYNLYQSPAGVVREELISMNRGRSVEGPMDVRLLDYPRGYSLVFDKGGGRAVKEPLDPPVPGESIGSRGILGFVCDGREYKWSTFQRSKVELRSWSTRDSDFKVPLLQLESMSESDGALLALRVRVVSTLEPASGLPASLFEPPPDLDVISFPPPK